MERREDGQRLSVLEEGFRRHEEGCDKRWSLTLAKLDDLGSTIARFQTTVKDLYCLAGAVISIVTFVLVYFQEAILLWLH